MNCNNGGNEKQLWSSQNKLLQSQTKQALLIITIAEIHILILNVSIFLNKVHSSKHFLYNIVFIFIFQNIIYYISGFS